MVFDGLFFDNLVYDCCLLFFCGLCLRLFCLFHPIHFVNYRFLVICSFEVVG